MKISCKCEFDDFKEFENKLRDDKGLDLLIRDGVQKVAKAFHQMLITRTPVVTGHLRSGWGKGENLLFNVVSVNGGYEVTFTNDVSYASHANDGHYSYNQYGGAYLVKNRTPKIYDVAGSNKSETYVFGHFFVEKAVVDMQSYRLEKIIYAELEKLFM